MSFSKASLIVAAWAFTHVHAAMGPALSTGPVGSGTFIREATSTLVLPGFPIDSSGILSLWVGMGTSIGDLIQSIADHDANVDASRGWGIFAYTLAKTGENSQEQFSGPVFNAEIGDRVTMHYQLNDSTGNYTQTVSVNDEVVSTLGIGGGQAQGWGSAVECADTSCGTIPTHSWEDTTIILDAADPGYVNTLGKAEQVTGGDMSTSDGGKTWTITNFQIPEHTF